MPPADVLEVDREPIRVELRRQRLGQAEDGLDCGVVVCHSSHLQALQSRRQTPAFAAPRCPRAAGRIFWVGVGVTGASLSASERARKGLARVLQSIARPGSQAAISAAMGVSDATVSRIKNERLEECLLFLACAGFKTVPADKVCVDLEELQMLRRAYVRMIQDQDIAHRLFGDDD